MKNIKVIESSKAREQKYKIKRVAAYARVSTKNELQESSLDLQVKHYAKEIIFNPDYIFAGIYYDHGKSGTSMIKRDGLQALLKKIHAGQVDLVLVKSLSRFARNTLDALKVLQETRKLGVEFFFEKENISSLDTSIDMILTMIAGMAEAESQQMSSNIRWGSQSRAKNGQVKAFKTFGYVLDKDKKYAINELEAEAVRTIYQMKLDGKSNKEMLDYLNSNNFTTSVGKPFYTGSQITNILRDEKYIGKITYGKRYVKTEGFEKQSVINEGERPKYIISNHHETIIDEVTFNKVQEIIETAKRINDKPAESNHSEYKRFVYSFIHKAYLYRKKKYINDPKYDLLENDYFRNPHFPRFYVRHVSKVLLKSLNALGSKFSALEQRFDKQVNELLSKQSIEQRLEKQEELLNDYMRQYYQLERKSQKDSKDRALLFELEDIIIQESMKYTSIEDEYLNIHDALDSVESIKKAIKQQSYPIKELDSKKVTQIFEKFVIVDKENYVSLINISGKELNLETMKNAVTREPLHEGSYKTNGKSNLTITWRIILV